MFADTITGGDKTANSKPAPSTHPRQLPEQPQRFLVADDEHLVATGLETNLQELGMTIVGMATDGVETVELCRREKPDMALIDIRMPRQSGLEAAAIVYQQLQIPVIIISAYSDPEYVNDGCKIGVFGYLLKPISKDQLRVGVSIAWSRYLRSIIQEDEIQNIKTRLEHRKTIERAKWIIVKQKGISEPEAMKTLQRQARNNRRTLIDVAQAILDSDELFQAD